MILYIDQAEVPDVENISPEILRYVIAKSERANRRYQRLMNYYLGEHAIKQRKHQPEEIWVCANYAKYVVDIVLDYYLGEPVKYDANDTAQKRKKMAASDSEDAPVLSGTKEIDISPLQDAYDAQQISMVDTKTGRFMGIYGEALELCYASTDAVPGPRSACIDPRNGVLVCDSTVEHNKLFGLVWEQMETSSGKKYYLLTVYTDRTEKDFHSADLKTAIFSQVGETREHFFGGVPLIAYENNDQRQGDFEQVTSLIDAYDELLSNRLTDKKKFVDALLVFFGMTLREGDESKLVKEKFLDGAPLDARAEYIQKTFDESSVQVLADALVREIHKQTMTVDMSDEQFAGNSSGQALKLKLLTMTMLAKSKIAHMKKGLGERFALYNHWLGAMGVMEDVSVTDVDIVFTISTPINEQEIVQTVTSLQGIVDDQTLLAQLWFITDPEEALENIKRQKAEAAEQYAKTFGPGLESEEDDKTPYDPLTDEQ